MHLYAISAFFSHQAYHLPHTKIWTVLGPSIVGRRLGVVTRPSRTSSRLLPQSVEGWYGDWRCTKSSLALAWPGHLLALYHVCGWQWCAWIGWVGPQYMQGDNLLPGWVPKQDLNDSVGFLLS